MRTSASDIVLNRIVGSPWVPKFARWRLLALLGVDITRPARISAGCWFGGRNISVGSGTELNRDVFIDDSAHVSIGRHCDLGMRVVLCTSSHEIGGADRRAAASSVAPIVIGDASWIGAGTIVLPGVTIERGCVVAAGSVVVGDCRANGLYAGVPAVRVRDLPLDDGA